jgi:hypothetical protein
MCARHRAWHFTRAASGRGRGADARALPVFEIQLIIQNQFKRLNQKIENGTFPFSKFYEK